MIARKTGALFECACRLGAMVAGATPAVQDAYAAYGLELGIGFQEQDDILGVWGAASETGKPDAADVRERKKGLPAALALSKADAPDWLGEAYAAGKSEMPPELVRRVIAHFDETGVRTDVERRAAARYQRARALLASTGGHDTTRGQLAAICNLLDARRA